MIILLSPAKSLDFESKFLCKNHSLPCFKNETEKLVLALKKFSISDLENLMQISKKLAELNFSRFQNFAQSPSRQALLAFDGDVYDGINKKNFSEKNFEFAQKHLRILSGLYGLLRPLDLIHPYRLEMGTNFRNFSFPAKNLYEFWGDKISQALEKLDGEHVINLASEEYFSAVRAEKISKKIINIIFKEKKNGTLKIVGINAKRARGLMTNFAIKNEITDPQQLKKFSEENYSFAKDLSDQSNWVFTR